MKITASDLIVRYMEGIGIRYIFGMPGAHILPVYDRLYDSSIDSILVKHEQGAAFMAGGYARASGGIGACITTAGPGATNLVTGIASAYADQLPILIITGETSTHIFGKGGLQESSGEGGSIDQAALFSGITRYHRLVERTDYLGQVLSQASQRLFAAQPGPVLLSFPFNVQQEQVDSALLDNLPGPQHGTAETAADSPQGMEIAGMILAARAPVIIAGYGCIRSGSQQLVAELSAHLDIPVATSLKAKGVIDEQSPLSLGSLGVTSSGYARNYITDQADLLIVLGAGFNERTSYLWRPELLAGKRIVQIDKDPQQLEKLFQADIALAADLHQALQEILRHLRARRPWRALRQRPRQQVAELRRGPGRGDIFAAGFDLVEQFFAALERCCPDGAQLFDDNILYAQNFLRVGANTHYFPNSGISSLGHAIPAAIGARLHQPRPTFAILGDGGFQMCGMELMTAVNYRVPINVILFNNQTLGLIRKNQHQQYRKRYIDCDFQNPDFELLARSFGIRHYRVTGQPDIERLFAEADLCNDINLIEVLVDKDAFPNYRSGR